MSFAIINGGASGNLLAIGFEETKTIRINFITNNEHHEFAKAAIKYVLKIFILKKIIFFMYLIEMFAFAFEDDFRSETSYNVLSICIIYRNRRKSTLFDAQNKFFRKDFMRAKHENLIKTNHLRSNFLVTQIHCR